MINLHERMLPTSAGVEPATSWSPVGRRIQLSHRGRLYNVVNEGKLVGPSLMDYLSYTTKVYQLVQRFSLVSVLLFDREYHKLQGSMNFRWGTDVQHLHHCSFSRVQMQDPKEILPIPIGNPPVVSITQSLRWISVLIFAGTSI